VGKREKSSSSEAGGHGRWEWGTEKALRSEEKGKAEVWMGSRILIFYPQAV